MNFKFESEHLRFRKFEKRDVEELFRNHSEKELKLWIPNECYENIQETEEAIEFFSDSVNKDIHPFVLAIELKENNCLIGDIGLNQVEGYEEQIEIGYSISEKYQRQGYASEAVTAFTDYAARHFTFNTLYARIMHGNIASVKVMEKCNYNFLREEFDSKDDPYGQGMLIYKLEL